MKVHKTVNWLSSTYPMITRSILREVTVFTPDGLELGTTSGNFFQVFVKCGFKSQKDRKAFLQPFNSTAYRGARCELCTTMHNNA